MTNRIKSCTQVQEDQKAEDTSIRGEKGERSLCTVERMKAEWQPKAEMVHADCFCPNGYPLLSLSNPFNYRFFQILVQLVLCMEIIY